VASHPHTAEMSVSRKDVVPRPPAGVCVPHYDPSDHQINRSQHRNWKSPGTCEVPGLFWLPLGQCVVTVTGRDFPARWSLSCLGHTLLKVALLKFATTLKVARQLESSFFEAILRKTPDFLR